MEKAVWYAKCAMFIVGGALLGAAQAFPQHKSSLEIAGAGLMALPLRIDALLAKLLPGAKP
jgi:hypothetical protein